MAEPIASVITLTSKQQSLLEQIVRRPKSEQGLVNRARTILLAASGVNNTQIGQQLHLSRACVRKWRLRWQQESAKLLGVEAEALRAYPKNPLRCKLT